MTDPTGEAEEILTNLALVMPNRITGQDAIFEMKQSGSRNWRQMEWIGFWFEHLVERELRSRVGFSMGPKIGRTRFDLVFNFVWDLKVHPKNSKSRGLILNDQEAVDTCVRDFGGFGLVVVIGNAEYDNTGEFKAWHDELKGGRSPYEVQRVKRGAPSRRRKVAFRPFSIDALFLRNQTFIQRGLDERWLGHFQTGMRNSNGTARRTKYQIYLDKAPRDVVVARRILQSEDLGEEDGFQR